MKLNQKGLTLVEVIIALAIFSIIILVAVSSAVSYINGKKEVNRLQQAVEEESVMMNEMAKRIRMSNCDSDCVFGTSYIQAWDNSSADYIYEFDLGSKELHYQGTTLLEHVDGKFLVSYGNYTGGEIPLITIIMQKFENDNVTPIPGTTVQTSVSMRSGYKPE